LPDKRYTRWAIGGPLKRAYQIFSKRKKNGSLLAEYKRRGSYGTADVRRRWHAGHGRSTGRRHAGRLGSRVKTLNLAPPWYTPANQSAATSCFETAKLSVGRTTTTQLNNGGARVQTGDELLDEIFGGVGEAYIENCWIWVAIMTIIRIQ